MSAPTNLVTTLTSVGNREDLEDVIYRVAPEKTPMISSASKTKATQRFHEWETETLATPDATNAALEGDDVGTLDAGNQPARLGNYAQIFTKKFGVSRTQQKTTQAGVKNPVTRQKVLKGIEMRRDMEKRFIGNFASNAESGGTPRHSAGLLAYLTTNVSRGAGGSSGGFSSGVVAAATNGTQRTFTESLLKAAWATAFNTGANPSQAYMGATNKQQFAAFTGIADIRTEVKGREQATIIAGAEVYVGDFGELMLIPHPYGLSRDMVAVDPDYVAVATLDGFNTEPLAKTGDSDRYLLTHEAGLECKNEAAHFVVADLI